MMIVYALIGADGRPSGFWPSFLYSDGRGDRSHPQTVVPADAIEITEAQWTYALEHNNDVRWTGSDWVDHVPPPPPLTEADYTRAIQTHLDAQAQARQYDSIQSAVTYIDDPNPTYAAEAAALRDWRSSVWTYALAELARVQAGERVQPSVEDLVAELPPLAWPA